EAEGAAHRRGPAQAAGQRGLLGRREEAQRDLPDGRAGAEAVHPRRDRLRPRHRRAADRLRRRQRPAQPGPGHARHHALPAAVELHRAGQGPRPHGRPHRQVRRQGAGTGTGSEGVRLDRGRGRGRRRRVTEKNDIMIQVMHEKDHYLTAFEQFEKAGADGTPFVRRTRKAAIASFGELGFPTARSEDWKFTNLASLTRVPFRFAEPAAADRPTVAELEDLTFPTGDGTRLVFVNGEYVPELS